MKSKADVVVIGAGVIGCSTAYHLAKMGIRDVVVVEMDQVGSGTSSKSASMLSLQFGSNELIARMAKYSYSRYMNFKHEFGVSPDFKKTGRITLATQESAQELRDHATILQNIEIVNDLLDPQEIHKLYPEIYIDDIALGTWGPDNGSFDPHMILWGYMKRAKQMGVELYEGILARDVLVRNGEVKGVGTDRGFIETNVVVNAAGPWAIKIGRWVDVEIPIKNSARCILVTGSLPEIPANRPSVKILEPEWYFRPEGEGVLIGMGEVPTDDLSLQIHNSMQDTMIDMAVHRVPVMNKAAVMTAWTGIRPLTSDGLPILGPVHNAKGFLLNCGWGGMGIIQSPLAGQLMAEYITDGESTTMDIGTFKIERFGIH